MRLVTELAKELHDWFARWPPKKKRQFLGRKDMRREYGLLERQRPEWSREAASIYLEAWIVSARQLDEHYAEAITADCATEAQDMKIAIKAMAL